MRSPLEPHHLCAVSICLARQCNVEGRRRWEGGAFITRAHAWVSEMDRTRHCAQHALGERSGKLESGGCVAQDGPCESDCGVLTVRTWTATVLTWILLLVGLAFDPPSAFPLVARDRNIRQSMHTSDWWYNSFVDDTISSSWNWRCERERTTKVPKAPKHTFFLSLFLSFVLFFLAV